MQNKIEAINELNETLKGPEELCGIFLPPGAEKRTDVLLLAEMPSMNEPKGPKTGDCKIPNFGTTARDDWFREMLEKYGLSGVYVTDIVKRRDIPRRPTEYEIEQWLPFLNKEISILNPNMVIVIGKRTYDSFLRYVVSHLDNKFRHDFIFHYCSQVPRVKFESRLQDVVTKYNLARQ